MDSWTLASAFLLTGLASCAALSAFDTGKSRNFPSSCLAGDVLRLLICREASPKFCARASVGGDAAKTPTKFILKAHRCFPALFRSASRAAVAELHSEPVDSLGVLTLRRGVFWSFLSGMESSSLFLMSPPSVTEVIQTVPSEKTPDKCVEGSKINAHREHLSDDLMTR